MDSLIPETTEFYPEGTGNDITLYDECNLIDYYVVDQVFYLFIKKWGGVNLDL